MDFHRDIHPLTDFKRNTAEFINQLRETGEPVVLTVNGKAELVVQDAKSYQRLHDLAERLETIQAVREGLASADRGEGHSMDDVYDPLEANLRHAKAIGPSGGAWHSASSFSHVLSGILRLRWVGYSINQDRLLLPCGGCKASGQAFPS